MAARVPYCPACSAAIPARALSDPAHLGASWIRCPSCSADLLLADLPWRARPPAADLLPHEP